MTIPDETLMAYVDGELDPAERAEVEAALRQDSELAARAERHRRLRSQLESAYAPELEEPVPERLLAALKAPAAEVADPKVADPKVADLAARRAAAASKAASARPTSVRWRAASMAAGLVLAVGAAFLLWHGSEPIVVRSADGALVASGALARSLSDQLSGDSAPKSRVSVGLSFVAKSGDYCRAFSISRGSEGAGLACRRNDRWQIGVLTQPESNAQGASGEFRTAGSSLPPAVLSAVEQEISGEPLDRDAEIAARGREWRASR
jgi:hypothetical protein